MLIRCGTADTRRPVNVNPLVVSTPEEKRLYALGERNSKIRKQRKDTALTKHTPNDLESDLIHAFWQKQLQYRTCTLWTSRSLLSHPVHPIFADPIAQY